MPCLLIVTDHLLLYTRFLDAIERRFKNTFKYLKRSLNNNRFNYVAKNGGSFTYLEFETTKKGDVNNLLYALIT